VIQPGDPVAAVLVEAGSVSIAVGVPIHVEDLIRTGKFAFNYRPFVFPAAQVVGARLVLYALDQMTDGQASATANETCSDDNPILSLLYALGCNGGRDIPLIPPPSNSGAAVVTNRLPVQKPLLGDGSPNTIRGSVRYRPNADQTTQSIALIPATNTNLLNGSTRYTGVAPAGAPITANDAARGILFYDRVPIGTRMVPFDVTSAPRWGTTTTPPSAVSRVAPVNPVGSVVAPVPSVRQFVPSSWNTQPAPKPMPVVAPPTSPLPPESALEMAERRFFSSPHPPRFVVELNGTYEADWITPAGRLVMGTYDLNGHKISGNGPDRLPSTYFPQPWQWPWGWPFGLPQPEGQLEGAH
jgi:hypothetical protein